MLEQLANLGEFISGIAVIASLIYLALQIRQNTQAVRSSTLLENTGIWTSMLLQISERENLAAFNQGYNPSKECTSGQLTQFMLQCRSLFVAFENQHYQYRTGTLDSATYEGYEQAIRKDLLSYPGFRQYWAMHREVFSPEFCSYVDDMIASTPLKPGDTIMRQWHKQLQSMESESGATET